MNSLSIRPLNHPSPASDQAQTSVQAATGPDTPPKAPTETASKWDNSDRQQPIPSLPNDATIGLVRGRYSASDEQFTQGTLVATDRTKSTPSYWVGS